MDSDDTNISLFIVVPQVPETVHFFTKSFFSLLNRLNSIDTSSNVLIFPPCHLHSAIESTELGFTLFFSDCIFQSPNFHLVLLDSFLRLC